MDHGIDNFVFLHLLRCEQVENWLRRSPTMRLLNWKTSREAILWVPRAVRACLHHCNDDIMVVNGDSLTLMDLRAAANRLRDPSVDGVIVGKTCSGHQPLWPHDGGRRGICSPNSTKKKAAAGSSIPACIFSAEKSLKIFPTASSGSSAWNMTSFLRWSHAGRVFLFIPWMSKHTLPRYRYARELGAGRCLCE